MVDGKKLMDLEYLNNYIVQVELEINRIKASYLDEYTLDMFKKSDVGDIRKLFDKYGVSCKALIEYLSDDYIDPTWEFADLFADDMSYSGQLRDDLKQKALVEIEALNKQMMLVNEDAARRIFELEGKVSFANAIITIIKSDNISDKQINNLYAMLLNCGLSEEVIYNFSCVLVKHLTEKIKAKVSAATSKEVIVTDDFERKLSNIYDLSSYDSAEEETLVIPSCNETVVSSYNEYKHLFDHAGLGDSIYEILELSFELSNGLDVNVKTMSKDSFCIELGAILYRLNKASKEDKTDQNMLGDLLGQLKFLDRLYDEDCELSEYKKETLNNIDESLLFLKSMMGNIDINDCIFVEKIKNRLNLLAVELKENLMFKVRKNEINKIYKEIQKDMKKVPDLVKQIKRLLKLSRMVDARIKENYSDSRNFIDGNYENLTKFKEQIAEYLFFIQVNDYAAKNDQRIDDLYKQYETLFDKKEEKSEICLKGFVLFDFDNNNVPYVLSDLDPGNMRNFIDESIEKGKLRIAYEDYSKLLNDLLLIGEPEILTMDVSAPHQILDKVYLDKERQQSTNMVRIRPTRNSNVRFMSEKVVLKPEMPIFGQVVDLLEETLPNVKIDRTKEFKLHINYCSAIKMTDEDSYHAAINRYYKNGPLQQLFTQLNSGASLSDEQRTFLKDIINMTLNAYKTLEQKNSGIRCDIINVIGGGKRRG